MLNFKRCTKKPFLGIIAEEMKKMGLITEFVIEKIDNRQEYDVKVKIKGSSSFVNIPDVGFGVSQVLPVIVELFYAARKFYYFYRTTRNTFTSGSPSSIGRCNN